MANNIAPEWPIDNDALWWCEITEKVPNSTTGEIEEVPVIGLTDVVAFPTQQEALKDATTIHADLNVDFVNVTGTNRYYGYARGDHATTHLGVEPYVDAPIFIHMKSASARWHEVVRTMVRSTRTAT